MTARQLYTTITMQILMLSTAWAQGPHNTGTYYQAADGQRGEALKTAMFQIVNGAYQGQQFQQIKYGSGNLDGVWGAFATTDVLDDGVTIRDRYSNITHYQVGDDQQGTGGTNSQEGGTAEKHVYSREHSMPKSWFGGGTDVGPSTDLFHLYPVDSYMNSVRNNHPYGENDGEKFTSAGGYSKLGVCTFEGYTGTCFEPNDEWKGDFARTYFYMVTCYENVLPTWYSENAGSYEGAAATFDGNKYPGLSEWQLKMLLKWSRQDPVDSIEIRRNEAVCAIQHNRNPFIDYPGLAEYIWGDSTLYAFSYDCGDTPVVPVRKYLFRKVLIIKSGKRYLIVADNDGTLRMAAPFTGTKTYGYLPASDVTANERGVIALEDASSAFTFETADAEGTYYVKDSSGRYVYQTSNYNSFNVSADMPAEGATWTATATDDGLFTVTNVAKNKYVQYSVGYTTWGCYADEQGLLPSLYEEVLMGDVNRDGTLSIADVTALVNIILGKTPAGDAASQYDLDAADVNFDGAVSIADVTSLVNTILGKN